MADSQIRWKQGDYIKLGKAVAEFNKKINELQTEENKLYLPELKNYKNMKENITTRKELNRLISSLKRFQSEGAEDLYTTDAGEELTKWERNELQRQSKIAQRRLMTELNKIDKVAKPYTSQRELEIKAQLKNLRSLESKKGAEFKRLKQRIINVGTSDYQMRKAIIYQDNYLKEMEKYSHFENYDKLMTILKAVKNPIKFFELVSNNNELNSDLTYQSDQYYSQRQFNKFVESFGIDSDDIIGSLDEMDLL